jgi:dienelactone hydrolase
MKGLIGFFAITLVLASCTQQRAVPLPPPLMRGIVRPGSFDVGYRAVVEGNLTAHIWYPLRRPEAPLAYADYAGSAAGDIRAFLVGAGVDTAVADSLLRTRMLATRGTDGTSRGRVLILVAQGNAQDVVDQAVLCEYLASRGFVVATTASPMVRAPMTREDQVAEYAAAQASDLATVARVAARETGADSSRLGVIGHSFGARAALLLAMRDRRVKAMVSLDGGIGTANAMASMRTAPSFDPSAPLPPLLHFYETLDPFMKPDFSMIEALPFASRAMVLEPAMHHVHFTTYGFAAARYRALGAVTHANEATAHDVAEVAERTASFLLSHLGGK